MNTLDAMLKASAEEVLPPLIRHLKSRLAAGVELSVEVYKPETAFGSSLTELILHCKESGKESETIPVDWDSELNTWLVNLGVRAINISNEGKRFSLGLRAALRKVERQFGDGYLNVVLIELIDESNLSKDGMIAEVRKSIHSKSADRSSKSYLDCREQIASEIGARAAELREKLKYNEDEIMVTMSHAIASYLDDRFSVSRRRMMGAI